MLPFPLRTIQVVNVRWFNATAWYGLKLASLLNSAGNESRVIALGGTESFRKACSMGMEPVAIPLNTTNPLELPGVLASMKEMIREFRPHIVNCHRGEGFLFWGGLKAYGRYGLVRTRGDQRLPRGNWPNRILHTRVADAVIATNTVMTRYFAEHIHVPSDRLYTILGGVDTDFFRFDEAGRAAVRARYGFTDSDCVLGLLGRFDKVKGQKELIESVARLVGQGMRQIRLLLLGFSSATSQEEVEGWIRETGMEHHVIISGRVDDVPACLSALDLGIVASLWSETIARAALEIMACGCPLISTSVGVMPDLLPPEALVSPGDAAGLDRLIRRGVEDVSWREHLTGSCTERIAGLRDRDFLDQTLAVYDRVLQRGGGLSRS